MSWHLSTTQLSEEAQEVAQALNVHIKTVPLRTDYPMIKCNVNIQTKEKIYHLAFDQQYDKIIIGNQAGESYVRTVKEAEDLGFRRAWRFQGTTEAKSALA